MSMKMNQSAYQKLIDEDLAWLLQKPRTLERDHIAAVLRYSIKMHYPEPPDKAESTLPPRSWRKVCICRTKDLANEGDNRRSVCSTPQCTCPCHPENR
jgi:hypothetical protein